MEYGYQGLRKDATINYVYNQDRWYSTTLFVFISQDPLGFGGGQTNWYARTGDEPLGNVDPLGLLPEGATVHEDETGKWEYSGGPYKEGVNGYQFNIAIIFTPKKAKCDCGNIRFVQIARVTDSKTGASVAAFKNRDRQRAIDKRKTGTGWFVDSKFGKDEGWYGSSGGASQMGTTSPSAERLKEIKEQDNELISNEDAVKATLIDRPNNDILGVHFEFVSCAACGNGRNLGKVYGCVSWGFAVNANGKIRADKPTYVPASTDWFKAVDQWNKQSSFAIEGDKNSANQQALPNFIVPRKEP